MGSRPAIHTGHVASGRRIHPISAAKAELSPYGMGWGSEITILKAVPAQAGDGWRVFIQWASGQIQYISGFESLQDAENWIASEAQNWLKALNTQL
jgi:hypothetical protein